MIFAADIQNKWFSRRSWVGCRLDLNHLMINTIIGIWRALHNSCIHLKRNAPVKSLGGNLIGEGLIIQYEPEDNCSYCINFGKKIAEE